MRSSIRLDFSGVFFPLSPLSYFMLVSFNEDNVCFKCGGENYLFVLFSLLLFVVLFSVIKKIKKYASF